MSGFTTNELLYPLTKGDSPGHPFRGNQYTAVELSQEVAHRITSHANDFYKSGGRVAMASELGAKELKANTDRISAQIKSLSSNPQNAQKVDGLEHILSALDGDGTKFLALNSNGEIVGAVGVIHYYQEQGDTDISTMTYLGSDSSTDGTASALEHAVAKDIQEVAPNSALVTDIEPQAMGYHRAMGRAITEPYYNDEGQLPFGTWTPEQVKDVANLPIGPEHL
jgi:hypothetical protein